MERMMVLIALFSCLVAGTTLFSCTIDKTTDGGYTKADFIKHSVLKKKYKNLDRI
jgi:hypothetical protein